MTHEQFISVQIISQIKLNNLYQLQSTLHKRHLILKVCRRTSSIYMMTAKQLKAPARDDNFHWVVKQLMKIMK